MPLHSSIRRLSRGALLSGGALVVACAPAASLGSVSLELRERAEPGMPGSVRLEMKRPPGYGLAALPSLAWTEARATCYSPTAMTRPTGRSLAFANWDAFPAATPPYYKNKANTAPFPALRGAADYYLGFDLCQSLSSPTRMVTRAFGYVTGQTLMPGANSAHVTLRPFGAVTTLAGSADLVDGTSPSAAVFTGPNGVAIDTGGNVFASDSGNNRIVRIDAGTGTVTTFAGAFVPGAATEGTGTAARFNGPGPLAFDSAGNLYVSDTSNNRIRRITPVGVVTTYTGSAGSGYADGTLATAKFSSPQALVFDSADNLYVADASNHCVRRIDRATGAVTTVAGRKPGVDGNGGTIYYGYADGVGANAAFRTPRGLALDEPGQKLYVMDAGNYRVRTIDLATTAVSTLAGSGSRTLAEGVGTAASFRTADALIYDGAGSLYVSDSEDSRIRKIDIATATVTTAAGSSNGFADHATATSAKFRYVYALARDPATGALYVSDPHNHAIRKFVPGGGVTTVAGSVVSGFADGTLATARFRKPTSVASDAAGNLYVADESNYALRKLAANGTVTTLLGNGSAGGGTWGLRFVYAAPDGYVYFGDDGDARVARVPQTGGSKEIVAGGLLDPATGGRSGYIDDVGENARFNNPRGMAMDSHGNLFVADQSNHCIRKVDMATRAVTTFAGRKPGVDGNGNTIYSGNADGVGTDASFNNPRGLAIDGEDNLYVADISNHRIRKIAPDGTVTTLVGSSAGYTDGQSTAARFSSPYGLTIDAGGNLYVADLGNRCVRKIARDGFVTTVAGRQGQTAYVDAADGDAARFTYLQDVALGPDGALYIADQFANAIRKIL